VLLDWIRSKVSKAEEPAGKACISCLKQIPGASEKEWVSAGGVLLRGAGWFCGARCENKYRLRFRIPLTRTTSGETRAAAGGPSSSIPATEVETAAEPSEPERTPAAEVLANAMRAGRRVG
jgi:hypothetical protein